MKNDEANFKLFGKVFQEKLVQVLIRDHEFAEQIGEVIDTKYFDLKFLENISTEIYDYRDRYGEHPTTNILITTFKTEYDKLEPALRARIVKFLNKTMELDFISDEKAVKEKSLEFCKKQIFKSAIFKMAGRLNDENDTSSFDDIKKIFDEAVKLGIDRDFGHDYIVDFDERYSDDTNDRNPVPTEWKPFNEVADGGLGRGELGIIIAPSGCGKSFTLASIAAGAMKAGLCVFFYTLELRQSVVAKRFDALFSGIEINHLKDNKERVFDATQRVPGFLRIKSYPSRYASVGTLDNHIARCVSNFNLRPDLIVVDYADHLKSPFGGNVDKRHALEEINMDLRALGGKWDAAVWTASQTNRTGVDKPLLTNQSIAEAFQKTFPADLTMTLARTKEDKNSNTGRFLVTKNRNGPDDVVFNLYMNLAKSKIEVLGRTTPDEVMENYGRNDNQRSNFVSSLEEKMREFNQG